MRVGDCFKDLISSVYTLLWIKSSGREVIVFFFSLSVHCACSFATCSRSFCRRRLILGLIRGCLVFISFRGQASFHYGLCVSAPVAEPHLNSSNQTQRHIPFLLFLSPSLDLLSFSSLLETPCRLIHPRCSEDGKCFPNSRLWDLYKSSSSPRPACFFLLVTSSIPYFISPSYFLSIQPSALEFLCLVSHYLATSWEDRVKFISLIRDQFTCFWQVGFPAQVRSLFESLLGFHFYPIWVACRYFQHISITFLFSSITISPFLLSIRNYLQHPLFLLSTSSYT